MKPDAIKTAAIEVLDIILSSTQPASEIINAYTRARRYIGSKDRRQLTNLVWLYIRHYRRLNFLYPNDTVEEKINHLSDNELTLSNMPLAVRTEVPDWLPDLIDNAPTELTALLETPSVVLRANGNRDKIQKELIKENLTTEPTTLSPYGLILKQRVNLQGLQAYRTGLIEVQDEGSQCVALETGIQPNMRVLDYCAGAGGKSLIFAQMMKNQGKIIAHDTSDKSLAELKKRAERAKATCIEIQKPVTDTQFDYVVADVPCSGTGTWRRCPDMRWKLTQEQLKNLVKTQADILDITVKYVKSQGMLAYITCSLTRVENTEQVQNFLIRHPNFKLIKQKQFSPALTQTDGLFIATFQRD